MFTLVNFFRHVAVKNYITYLLMRFDSKIFFPYKNEGQASTFSKTNNENFNNLLFLFFFLVNAVFRNIIRCIMLTNENLYI
jgi:hypothetical protein